MLFSLCRVLPWSHLPFFLHANTYLSLGLFIDESSHSIADSGDDVRKLPQESRVEGDVADLGRQVMHALSLHRLRMVVCE